MKQSQTILHIIPSGLHIVHSITAFFLISAVVQMLLLSHIFCYFKIKLVLSLFLLLSQRRLLPDLQPNTESVGELWLGLLRFYTEEFDFKEHVISIRQTKRLTTFEKQWTSKCIAIEGVHTDLLSRFLYLLLNLALTHSSVLPLRSL